MTLLMTVPLIFLSAVMSGAFSMGGGVLALATFSLVLDPLSLIPFHGFIQFFSNLSRTVISHRNICLKPVILFAAGTAAGAITGRFFLLKLSPDIMSIIFAAGIIFFTWKRNRPESGRKLKGNYVIAGGVAGYFSLIFGVTGPLVAPFFLHDPYTREQLVATKSACQIFTHTFKIGVFITLGQVNAGMLKSAALFIPVIVSGNWLGQKLLGKLPEKAFMLIIKIIITLLALRMLGKALLSIL